MSSDDSNTEHTGGRKKRIDLKPTQAAASGMAAVTAAILGSELGWAGSVAGAGLASVCTTLASTLYQHTLDRTKESVKEKVVARTAPYPLRPTAGHGPHRPGPHRPATQRPATQRPATQRPAMQGPPAYGIARPQHGVRQPVPPRGQPAAPGTPQDTTSSNTAVNTGDQTRRTFAAIDPGTIVLGTQQDAKTEVVRPVPQPGAAPTQAMRRYAANSPAGAAATQVIAPQQARGSRLRWPLVIGLSIAATVFGLLVLTGLEVLNGGNPLVGDGKGTTLSGNGNSGGAGSGGEENDQQQVPVESGEPTESEVPEESAPAPEEPAEPTTEAPEERTTEAPTTQQRNPGGIVAPEQPDLTGNG